MKKKEEIVTPVPVKPKIAKLAEDFGREDLNQLARKINEIIDSQ